MRSFFPKCLLHSSFLIFIGMLFQVLRPRKSIVFWEKLAAASGVARFCDCLVLYLCMSLFSVNKSLNIFGVLLFLCLCTNLYTLIFQCLWPMDIWVFCGVVWSAYKSFCCGALSLLYSVLFVPFFISFLDAVQYISIPYCIREYMYA